jgi:hypothetical protein
LALKSLSYKFNGSSAYLGATSAVVTATPLSISALFNASSVHAGAILNVSGVIDEKNFFSLHTFTDSKVRATVFTHSAITTTTYLTDVWNHAFATFVNASDRNVWLNNGGFNQNTTAFTPAGLSHTTIGRRTVLTPIFYFNGDLAEVALWDVILTANERTWLSKFISPLTLLHRLPNLKFYRDLIREVNRPYIGPTLINTDAIVSQHPRVFYIPVEQYIGKLIQTHNISVSDTITFSTSDASGKSITEQALVLEETFKAVLPVLLDTINFQESFLPKVRNLRDIIPLIETIILDHKLRSIQDIIYFIDNYDTAGSILQNRKELEEALIFIETFNRTINVTKNITESLGLVEIFLGWLEAQADPLLYSPKQ